jgi:hypothetical protein
VDNCKFIFYCFFTDCLINNLISDFAFDFLGVFEFDLFAELFGRVITIKAIKSSIARGKRETSPVMPFVGLCKLPQHVVCVVAP